MSQVLSTLKRFELEDQLAESNKRVAELTERIQKQHSNDTHRAVSIDREELPCNCREVCDCGGECDCVRPKLHANNSSDHGYTQLCYSCLGWK